METIEIYQTIIDSMLDAIVIVDRNGKIIIANKNVKQLFGYEKQEVIGQAIEFLTPFHHSKIYKARYVKFDHNHKARKMGTRWKLEGRKKDATEFSMEIGLSSIRIKGLSFGMVSARDVTTKKKEKYTLKNTITLLEIKNKELKQIVYMTSHDLQEPLRTVSSFIELLKEQYQNRLDKNADIYISFILQSTERMRNLIKGLLDYSRIGREKTLEIVDCNEVLFSILDDFRSVINESGAKIKNVQLPTLYAYPNELKQLFQNLIGNAIKYVKQDVSPIINISCQQQDVGWLFEFGDNGIGIEEKSKEKIFIVFQRLHNRKEYDGTGIGLAHCKKIVELHNGKIWVESILNKGSRFCFTIQS